jgi:methenyltetrahydromethanopterin cyclohydrolase
VAVSMNQRIAGLADAVASDPDMTQATVVTLESGARVIDCGAQARGGLNAGLVFA